jgi:hypothetical protein
VTHGAAPGGMLPSMQVVVDGSAGGEPDFADEIARGLRDRGLEVEVRRPSSTSMFDTGVHLVDAGLAIRVPERLDAATQAALEDVVRAALQHRASLRRRARTVPVYLGETARALVWIDVFG